jgi:sulfite oxidase
MTIFTHHIKKIATATLTLSGFSSYIHLQQQNKSNDEALKIVELIFDKKEIKSDLEKSIEMGVGKVFNTNVIEANKIYTREEVANHHTIEDFWITYKDGVYDITNFVKGHPGGIQKIIMAAGGAIDDYWKIYKQHNNEDVYQLLEKYRIGKLEHYQEDISEDNNYINEPVRNGDLYYHTLTPCNAEANLSILVDNFITPTENWFIRNHHPVPDIKKDEYKLILELSNELTKEISLSDLDKYPKQTIVTTIQCAGNRRNEFNSIAKVHGSNWKGGAISTAEWEGVYLRDIFNDIDINLKENSDKYLTFWGDDMDYRVSLKVSRVLSNNNKVLLATKMNGEELSRDHGYPVRLIVPGSVGTKQVKWLTTIELSDKPSKSSWQSGVAYKKLPSFIKDFSQVTEKLLIDTPTVDIPPIQSMITKIKSNDKNIEIYGFAWCGGGSNINKVEVSLDNGKNWKLADLISGQYQPINQAWGWTLWSLNVNKEDCNEGETIICRATDINLNKQPKEISDIWNIRGILNNSWHRVKFSSNDI